jgi:N-acetylmuramoyl-L-alanine amidase
MAGSITGLPEKKNMSRRLQRAAAVLSILPCIAAAKTGINQVTGIRSWSHADSTRVIIETTGPVDYKVDRATNPDRLFFDLLHSQPFIWHKRYASRVVNDRLVHRVRIAETAPGTTRIVFDLTGPGSFRVSKLEAPDRLVIEIRPPGLVQVTELRARPVPAFIAPPKAPVFRGRVVIMAAVPPMLDPTPLVAPVLPDSSRAILSAKPPRQIRIVASAPPPPAFIAKISPPPSPAPHPLTYEAPAHASENASRSLTRALGLKVNRIVIDAGHGGHDEGTSGPTGVLEKDVVLDVALRLAKLVQTHMGSEVVLTRSDDTFIPLQERTAIANSHKADLFLSIHANSSPAPAVAGTETFFLNFTTTSSALDVAARENAGAEKSVGELKDLIQSITLNDKIAESQTFAQTVQNSLFAQAARGNAMAKNRGVKRAPFVVLIGASMPSILAEIGFLTNARDEANLAKPEYRQKIAEALYKGLSQYSQSLSHFELAGHSDKEQGKSAVAGLN